MIGGEESFGCERCWPATPDAAWKARASLSHQATVIDEAHCIASLVGCPVCSQRFVSVFAESIDWVGGEDPQWWVQLPLTSSEATQLTRKDARVTESDLAGLAAGKRSLITGFPSGGVETCAWGTGLSIGWHD